MSKKITARFALGVLTLGLAVATAAVPAAQAEESEGMGTQAVVEMVREQAIRSNASGWRNGMPTLVNVGGGQSVVYAESPSGNAGTGGTVAVTGNAGGGDPIVERQPAAPSPTLAMTR